jgi:hypothetical protein
MTFSFREVKSWSPGHYTNEGNDDETEFLKASTLSTYFRIAKMILDDLDHEYWIKYTGYDGRRH